VFLVVLFLLKTGFFFKNSADLAQNKEGEGLVYSTAIVQDLVNKDTDGDGVLDWEESLWETDPTKKETTPGTPDSAAISKLKTDQTVQQGESLLKGKSQEMENLTETDKFSRELFSTVAALNQSGAMDEATADKISNSLAEHIQNASPKKVYTLSDIKISTKDDKVVTRTYSEALGGIEQKYSPNYTVLDVLQKFSVDENNIDSSVLSELDPIIKQIDYTINAMLKINVPQSLATLHLNVINSMEKSMEIVSDLQLYDTDVIVALSAISQYDQNATTLSSDITNLNDGILKKINTP